MQDFMSQGNIGGFNKQPLWCFRASLGNNYTKDSAPHDLAKGIIQYDDIACAFVCVLPNCVSVFLYDPEMRWHDVPLPPHTPHLSTVLLLYSSPSQPTGWRRGDYKLNTPKYVSYKHCYSEAWQVLVSPHSHFLRYLQICFAISHSTLISFRTTKFSTRQHT